MSLKVLHWDISKLVKCIITVVGRCHSSQYSAIQNGHLLLLLLDTSFTGSYNICMYIMQANPTLRVYLGVVSKIAREPCRTRVSEVLSIQ